MNKSTKYNVVSAGQFYVNGVSYHGPVNNITLSAQDVAVLKALGFLVQPLGKPIVSEKKKPDLKVDTEKEVQQKTEKEKKTVQEKAEKEKKTVQEKAGKETKKSTK
jgi:hypothetical protein